MDEQEFIEQEVRRRVSKQLANQSLELAQLQEKVAEQRSELVQNALLLRQYSSKPRYFGEVIRLQDKPDPSSFHSGDEVLVVDKSSPFYRRSGIIVSGVDNQAAIDAEGFVTIQIFGEEIQRFSIGTHQPAQVRLAGDDGTSATVIVDGKPWKVNHNPGFDIKIGDTVLIDPDSKQIVGVDEKILAGPICKVSAITSLGIEIIDKHETRLVANPKQLELEEGDRVIVDSGYFIIADKLAAQNKNKYKVTADLNITWEQIGGLETAKEQFREAIELPFQNADLYRFYNIKKDAGLLLYGAPGCGKTLLSRAAAAAVARLHGVSANESGYYYIKSPEILDKWVGATEQEICSVFEQCRRHFRQHGYPAILVFDEFEAIAPQRGTRRSSDITDTLVPMFLGEMEGIDEQQHRENPIVILMTNRPEMLDQAIIRSGRISRHIKIERPDEDAALDILQIHSEKAPFHNDADRLQILAVAVQDIFSKNRLLYRINNEHEFVFGHAINGAILAAINEQAKLHAMRRNLSGCDKKGLVLEDYRKAVQLVYGQQRGLNHAYDLQDFCEKVGIQPQEMKFERCFGAC